MEEEAQRVMVVRQRLAAPRFALLAIPGPALARGLVLVGKHVLPQARGRHVTVALERVEQ